MQSKTVHLVYLSCQLAIGVVCHPSSVVGPRYGLASYVSHRTKSASSHLGGCYRWWRVFHQRETSRPGGIFGPDVLGLYSGVGHLVGLIYLLDHIVA